MAIDDQHVSQEVKALLEAPEPDLLAEAGRRLMAVSERYALAGAIGREAFVNLPMSVGDEASETVKAILRRTNLELRELVCGGGGNQRDRNAILNAFHAGDIALATSFVSAIVTQLGVSPALAAVLAVILVKRIGKPAVGELCNFWRRLSPD